MCTHEFTQNDAEQIACAGEQVEILSVRSELTNRLRFRNIAITGYGCYDPTLESDIVTGDITVDINAAPTVTKMLYSKVSYSQHAQCPDIELALVY